jgi:hypothetical protein
MGVPCLHAEVAAPIFCQNGARLCLEEELSRYNSSVCEKATAQPASRISRGQCFFEEVSRPEQGGLDKEKELLQGVLCLKRLHQKLEQLPCSMRRMELIHEQRRLEEAKVSSAGGALVQMAEENGLGHVTPIPFKLMKQLAGIDLTVTVVRLTRPLSPTQESGALTKGDERGEDSLKSASHCLGPKEGVGSCIQDCSLDSYRLQGERSEAEGPGGLDEHAHTNGEDTFDKHPEILHLVFEKLDALELLKVERVSKYFRAAAKDPHYWQVHTDFWFRLYHATSCYTGAKKAKNMHQSLATETRGSFSRQKLINCMLHCESCPVFVFQ